MLIGVIAHDGRGGGSEELLARFARSLRDRGENVGGLIQISHKYAAVPPGQSGKSGMELVDIRTDRHFGISQKLGGLSDACSLDSSALAEASQVLRREIEAGCSLLIINKFAETEAQGQGFLSEMFDAVSRGIPVLTSVSSRYRPQWDEISGGLGTMLSPDDLALDQWWAMVKRRNCQDKAGG